MRTVLSISGSTLRLLRITGKVILGYPTQTNAGPSRFIITGKQVAFAGTHELFRSFKSALNTVIFLQFYNTVVFQIWCDFVFILTKQLPSVVDSAGMAQWLRPLSKVLILQKL